ncbi:MAG: NAD-dependent epimerase/dehydratase family protein [Acidimicrobiia bacterium]|nr:NAD-dependent epimerase/dehydratase family protein [Acidimicrobiia bacterium]
MHILITGGLGFLGRLLTRALLAEGHLVSVVDRDGPADEPGSIAWRGDVGDAELLARAIGGGADAVVHLAAMVSAECEADFDGAWRVNVEGTRAALEACRHAPGRPRFVFSSSVAVFGGPDVGGDRAAVSDSTKQTPASTYGMTKALGELAVNDYTRKGYIDGVTARLPTVIVRPGVPNAAASSFASGMFREPLRGVPSVIPVAPDTPVCVIGYRAAVANLSRLATVPAATLARLGLDRAVGLPGLELDVTEMAAALRRVADRRGIPLGALDVRPDPAIEAVVGSWPGRWRAERAAALGLVADRSIEDVIEEYLADFG